MTIYTDGMTARPRGISEIESGLGGYLGAKVDEAKHEWPIARLADIGELRAASGERGGFGFGTIPTGDKPNMLSLSDANAKLKAEGLDRDVKLTIDGVAEPALNIMIARAKARREREATIERGPDSLWAGALGVGTSFLVGAVDPLNIAASFIPVVGQAKYAKQLADAGVSNLARAGVRARVGAIEGAVGQALIEPINAWATTQEGGDYTLTSALHSVMFGAALGTGLRTGGGAVADRLRAYRNRPLYPFDAGEAHAPLAASPDGTVLPGETPAPDSLTPSLGEQPPPVAPGFMRFYHGGDNPTSGGGRWVAENETYARNYREGQAAHYVDIPQDWLDQKFPDTDLYSPAVAGRSRQSYPHFEVPEQFAKQMKPLAGRDAAAAPVPLTPEERARIDAGGDSSWLFTDTFSGGKQAIDSFLAGGKTNEWIDVPEGKMYLRQMKRPGLGNVVDISNLSFETKGTGAFTSYLTHIEDQMLSGTKFEAIYVENIFNKRLIPFLEKRGYVKATGTSSDSPSMVMPKSRLEMLERTPAPPHKSPHVEALDDLPPRAKEDLTRVAIGGLVNGEPVRVGEVLNAAAADNPRIKESLDLVNRPEARASARRVGDDVAAELRANGADERYAKESGALVAARYAVRGWYLGRDPHELYQAYGVVVRRGGADQEAVTKTRAGLSALAGEKSFDQRYLATHTTDMDFSRFTKFQTRDSGYYGLGVYAFPYEYGKRFGGYGPVQEGQRNVLLAIESKKPFFVTWDDTGRIGKPEAEFENLHQHGWSYNDVPFRVAGENKQLDPLETSKSFTTALLKAGYDSVIVQSRRADGSVYQHEMVGFAPGTVKGQFTGRSMLDKGAIDNFVARLQDKRRLSEGRLVVSSEDAISLKTDLLKLLSDDGNKSFDQSQPTAPTFFSAVLRTIETAKLNKGSPDQWLATIKNTPGVKPEELEWLGLSEWLKQQKGSVAKEQVADYVRANQIEVKEVTKGDRAAIEWNQDEHGNWTAPDGRWIKPGLLNGEQGFVTYSKDNRKLSFSETLEQAKRNVEMGLANAPNSNHPKFSQYQLAGGDNYRELLLTLPRREESPYVLLPKNNGDLSGLQTRFANRDEAAAYYMTLPREKRFESEIAPLRKGPEFHSTHWDEPNVLAHVRFNDRVIDGKRTLFVEEIQSDWHQQGRERGYGPPPPIDTTGWTVHTEQRPREWGPVGTYEARIVRDAQGRDVWTYTDPGDTPQEGLIANAKKILERDQKQGVPDAPFKDTTVWSSLALKRMIKYAAENGYDQIAWTPGATHFERWGSEEIAWQKMGDGWRIHATEQRGGLAGGVDIEGAARARGVLQEVEGKRVTSKDQLREALKGVLSRERSPESINKLVDRVWDRMQTEDAGTSLPRKEGFEKFYDEMLGTAANKLTKKYGARVGEAELEQSSRGKGALEQDTFGDWHIRWEDGTVGEAHLTRSHAQEELRQLGSTGSGKPVTVHTLPITPELRDAAVSQGFPLFQKGGADEPRGRITLSENKAIIDLFNSADKSTFLHEAGHLFLDQLARDAQLDNVPQALKDDLGTVLRWLGVSKVEDIGVPEHEQWARGFEQYLASGEAPSNALVKAFQAFKEWLGAIYRSLRDLGEPIPDEIRAVMDRMLATDAEIAERRGPPKTKQEAFAELSRRESDQAQPAPEKAEHPASLQPQEIEAGLAREAPKAAEAAATPEQPKPLTPVSASAKAAATAEQLAVQQYEAAFAAGDITPEQRVKLDEVLKAIDAEAEARARVVREGAGCLAGGFGFAAAAPAKAAGEGAKGGVKITLPRDAKGKIAGAQLAGSTKLAFERDAAGMISGVTIG